MPRRPESEPTHRPPRREQHLVAQLQSDFAEQLEAGIIDQRQLQDFVRYYQHVGLRVLQVGDIDVRKAAEHDEAEIAQFQDLVSNLDELELPEVMNCAQNVLRFIRAPHAEHSVFGKLLCSILLADILVHLVLVKKHQSLHLIPSFKVSVESLASKTEKLVLFSAFQARIKHAVSRSPQIVAQLQKSLPNAADLKHPAVIENEVAIRTLATLYEKLIAASDVRLRLSVAALTESTADETVQGGHPEEGYPQTIMYLSPGHIPTMKKLFEALRYGIPEAGMLHQRLPRILFGVSARTTDPTGRLYLDQDERLQVVRMKFYHVNLAPLRMIDKTAKHQLSYDMPAVFSDRMAYELIGFDSFSYIIAGMISRKMRGNLQRIKTEVLAEQAANDWTEEQVSAEIDSRLLATFERVTSLWLERLQVEMQRQHASSNSLIGLAAEEYQRSHSQEVSPAAAVAHLHHNISLLVLKHTGQQWQIRSLEQIEHLFKKHVFERELSMTDQLSLALFLFSDPSCESWFHPLLDDQARAEIEQAVLSGQPDAIRTPQLKTFLIDLAREHFQVRAETIRDTTDPFREVPTEEARD